MPPRFQYALLGDSPAARPLVRSLAGDAQHTLAAAALPGDLAPEILAAHPGLRLYDRWEGLLAHARTGESGPNDSPIDAVIVAGADDRILDGARRLASEGVPLLVLPDGHTGATFFHELSLVRNDNRVLLAPVFPLRYLPEVSALRTAANEGKLGRIVQWQMNRELLRRSASDGPPLLTPNEINAALQADSDLLRSLGGPYNRVTAVYAGFSEGRYSSATVTLTGDGLPDALWTLRCIAEPADAAPHAASTILGPGRWTLTAVGSAGQKELRSEQIDLTDDPARPGWAHWILSSFADVARSPAAEETVRHDAPDWNDLIRAAEVVDGAQRSVARRRTIDLYHETASERGQFKSQMTAIGCAVMILTLMLVMGLLLVGATIPVPPKVMLAARIAVFTPLFLYLALQLLVFIARPSEATTRK